MKSNIEKAKEIFDEFDNLTIVLVKDKSLLTSTQRGIKPMIELLDNNVDLRGYSVCDRVVGKAVAFLFLKAGIEEVYASTISKVALERLERAKIKVTYQNLTDRILNRKGDGLCPMEEMVVNIDDEQTAYTMLKEKLKKMAS